MWSALIYFGCFVTGFVFPRWWLLPIPLVVFLIVATLFPVEQTDDFGGVGRFVTSIVATLVLAAAIAAGKIAHRRGWFSN